MKNIIFEFLFLFLSINLQQIKIFEKGNLQKHLLGITQKEQNNKNLTLKYKEYPMFKFVYSNHILNLQYSLQKLNFINYTMFKSFNDTIINCMTLSLEKGIS